MISHKMMLREQGKQGMKHEGEKESPAENQCRSLGFVPINRGPRNTEECVFVFLAIQQRPQKLDCCRKKPFTKF